MCSNSLLQPINLAFTISTFQVLQMNAGYNPMLYFMFTCILVGNGESIIGSRR